MKKLEIDEAIKAKLQRSVGADIDPEKYAVFKAVALNTRPIRKDHPLYIDARHSKSFLKEMKAAVEGESRPLQINHDRWTLPIGRVFAGEVVDQGEFSELQVLFWVDSTKSDIIELVDAGTVDQVSVSVLAKKAVSNKTGYDFFAEDSDPDNIWMGKDDAGNVMGKNGAFVILDGLDAWYEMSLVGQGGAVGARILSSNNEAEKPSNRSPLILSTSPGVDPPKPKKEEKPTMDLKELVADLTNVKADVLTKDAKIVELTAKITELTAKVEQLTADLAAAPKKDELDATIKGYRETVASLAAKTGNVDAKILEMSADALGASAKESLTKLGVVGSGGKTFSADSGATLVVSEQPPKRFDAFRAR